MRVITVYTYINTKKKNSKLVLYFQKLFQFSYLKKAYNKKK